MNARRKIAMICTGLALALAAGRSAANPPANELDRKARDAKRAELIQHPIATTTGIPARPGTIVGTGASSFAPEALLYDQTSSVNLNAASQNFEAANDAFDNQAADDFVVTAPGGWNITSVLAPGVYSVTHLTPASIHVTFYNDAPGVPGSVVCDFPALTYVEAPSGTYTIGIPGGCLLGPGTKWISVQVNMDFAGGAGGQWFWSTRTVLTGNPSQWQNPGGGFSTPCSTWGTRTTCLTQTDPDMVFSLSGDIASCTIDPDCTDGNLCNGVETCVAGSCVPGTPVDCNDSLFCTLDTCTPATGACVHAPNPCHDTDGCTVDGCVEATQTCTHTAVTPIQFCNTAAITIPSSGSGTPYPSTIAVAGLPPSASVCNVKLQGISHTWSDDIDILLVGPAGGASNATIMSDVGGGVPAAGVSLTLADAAATSLPDATALASGTFKPTNIGAGDTFAAPAPAPTGGSALSVFDGVAPNGTWSLFVTDDTGGDSGTIATGWCINLVVSGCTSDPECSDGNLCNGVETCSAGTCVPGTPVACDDGLFCTLDSCTPATGECVHVANPCDDGDACTIDSCDEAGDACSQVGACLQFCTEVATAINDSATPPTLATPYPSTISVSGMGALALVGSVDLIGISHTFPDDIDAMLVGPAGGAQNSVIVSDVGGSTDAVAVDLSLSDGAPTAIPDGGPMVTGVFKPSNVDTTTDSWPAPAPAPSGASNLTVLTGNPNGTWSLYITDDAGTDSGALTGWCVNLRPICATAADCDDANPCTTDACVATVCQHAANTDDCDDGNPCTIADACSAGSCSGLPVGTPSALNDSVRVNKTGSTAHIDWTDPTGPFNVYRGTRSGALWVYDHTCFAPGVSGPVVDDASNPGDGTTYYYLVSKDNGCNESALGFDSSATPIPNAAPCP